MTTAEVAAKAGATKNSSGFMARCPAHDDRKRSLSISTGEGGRALLNCFAGCATVEIVAALGLTMRDLFAEPQRRAFANGTGRKVVAEYDYVAEDGALLYKTLRHEPKDFRQKRPDEKGGWAWSLNGTRRVPYHLPELLAGIERGAIVLVVEGEKDVLAAETLGYTATTSAGGASWSWTEEFVEHFRGATSIAVVADADVAGRRAARQRAELLATVCADVRIIDFGAGRPKGYDISDLIGEGAGCAEIGDLIASATPVVTESRLQDEPQLHDFTRDCNRVTNVTEKTGINQNEGANLLEEIAKTFRRFIFMTEEQADTLALWVAHTHAFEACRRTPYPYVTSAEKRSGKTRTMEVAQKLVRDPLRTANISAPALFRVISNKKSTVLFDELDGIFRGHKSERAEDIRVILNAGFEAGTPAYRCAGKNGDTVVEFDVFCPKMLAGLRHLLPDTVKDRSIIIELKRKSSEESVQEFTEENEPQLQALKKRIEAWATPNVPTLRSASPERPKELHDRARDIWKPLLAIADLAGGEWPTRARNAAIALSGNINEDDASTGIRLLSDINFIYVEEYKDAAEDWIFCKTLAEKLAAIEDGPWGPKRGREFDARDLSPMLKHFGIKAEKKAHRSDDKVGKRYLWDSFFEPWRRYLSLTPVVSVTSVTRLQNETVGTDSCINGSENASTFVTDVTENAPEPHPDDLFGYADEVIK